jgi:hypothetical protein
MRTGRAGWRVSGPNRSSTRARPPVRRLALSAFLLVTAVSFTPAGGAGASSVPGGRPPAATVATGPIEDGSQWTLSSQAVFQGGCTVLTLDTHPDTFGDDIGDQGTWTGGKASLTLHFRTGAQGHPYGLSPGRFHGKVVKDSGFFSGSYRPTRPRETSSSASLVPGADDGC